MNKRIKVPIDIYKMDLYVYYGSEEFLEKEFAKTNYAPFVDLEIDGNVQGRCVSGKGIDPLVVIKENKKDTLGVIATLSHELLHAAIYVLEMRGIPIDGETDEALTYLHTYFMIESLKKLKIKASFIK